MEHSILLSSGSRTSQVRDLQPGMPQDALWERSNAFEEYGAPWIYDELLPSTASSPCPSLSDGESHASSTDEEEEETIVERDQSFYQPGRVSSRTTQHHFPGVLDLKLNTSAGLEKAQHDGPRDAPNHEKGSPVPKPSHLAKRPQKRVAEDLSSSDDGETPLRTSRKRVANEPPSSFACPFAKTDPARYSRCLAYNLKDVSRVRQHLLREHTRPIYCSRCGTTFERMPDLDAHMRQDPVCQIKPVSVEGVTETQRVTLLRRGFFDTRLSSAERWYQIWDLLFPDRERPASPYAESPDMGTLRAFSNHTAALLPTMISERLASELLDSQRPRLADLNAIITEGMNLVLEQFTAHWQGRHLAASEDHSNGSSTHNPARAGIGDVHRPRPPSIGSPDPSIGLILQENDLSPKDLNSGTHSVRRTTDSLPETVLAPPIETTHREGEPLNASTVRSLSTNDIWEMHKSSIYRLYMEENRPLNEVIAKMEEERGFRATPKMYKTRFARWGFSKYITSHPR
ncbi:Clr5 domain-containing protein [Hypoxylon sp. FL1284]|nr:Clr5 domain-containing protein [Hypoxylon sp. FL1284]